MNTVERTEYRVEYNIICFFALENGVVWRLSGGWKLAGAWLRLFGWTCSGLEDFASWQGGFSHWRQLRCSRTSSRLHFLVIEKLLTSEFPFQFLNSYQHVHLKNWKIYLLMPSFPHDPDLSTKIQRKKPIPNLPTSPLVSWGWENLGASDRHSVWE